MKEKSERPTIAEEIPTYRLDEFRVAHEILDLVAYRYHHEDGSTFDVTLRDLIVDGIESEDMNMLCDCDDRGEAAFYIMCGVARMLKK